MRMLTLEKAGGSRWEYHSVAYIGRLSAVGWNGLDIASRQDTALKGQGLSNDNLALEFNSRRNTLCYLRSFNSY